MKSIMLAMAMLVVLGTASAKGGYELTVWIDKYEMNNEVPGGFVPAQTTFEFDKKSDIELIYENDAIEFGARVKVLGLDEGFVTYKWELFQRKEGEKWAKVDNDNEVIETMIGSSKLMLQTTESPADQATQIALQYIVSLEEK